MLIRPMKPSTQYRILGIFILIIAGGLIAVSVFAGVQTLNEAIGNIIILIVGGLAGFAIPIIIWPTRFLGRKTDEELIVELLKPSLSHLTIHYSNPMDTPQTKRPSRPYYVVNNKRSPRQAYWVNDEVRELNKRGRIRWVSHESEEKMIEHFNDENDPVQYHKWYPQNGDLT